MEPWGEDPQLVALLGEQGAAGFRALFETFPEAVGVLWALRDPAGEIADFAFGYGNLAMLRSFRLPASMRDRYTLLEALPRMRGSRAFASYVEVCGTGVPWVDEITYDTPFGDGYMLGTFIQRTMKLGDGLIVFLTDVTRQRRMETELVGYADVVAHDLREPLASMDLLVRLLEGRPDEPPPPEALRMLRASTARARELIDGVLEYARGGELRTGQVALGELVAEVSDDLRPRLEETGATLTAGDLPVVEADRAQLRRVFQNLVGNALKFQAGAAPRIEISADRARHAWVLTVRDNGVGVPSDQAQRIFGMFARANGESEGAGIGLAICRRVVEAHGGRIWVEAADGGGSAFRFSLPQAK